MESYKGISTRTVIIVGSLILILTIGFHFYMLHDLSAFKSRVRASSVVHARNTLVSQNTEGISTQTGEVVAAKSAQTTNAKNKRLVDTSSSQESAGCGGCGCQ